MNLNQLVLKFLGDCGGYQLPFRDLQAQLTIVLSKTPTDGELLPVINELARHGYIDFSVDPLADKNDETNRRLFITEAGKKVLGR